MGAMRHLIFSDFLETFPEASQEPLERFRDPFGPHFGSILGSFFDALSHLAEVRFCCYLLYLRHVGPPRERLKSHFFQDPFREASRSTLHFIFLPTSIDFKTILGSPGDPLFPFFRGLFSSSFFYLFGPPPGLPRWRFGGSPAPPFDCGL